MVSIFRTAAVLAVLWAMPAGASVWTYLYHGDLVGYHDAQGSQSGWTGSLEAELSFIPERTDFGGTGTITALPSLSESFGPNWETPDWMVSYGWAASWSDGAGGGGFVANSTGWFWHALNQAEDGFYRFIEHEGEYGGFSHFGEEADVFINDSAGSVLLPGVSDSGGTASLELAFAGSWSILRESGDPVFGGGQEEPDDPIPTPLPPALAALIAGLGALVLLRRRQRSPATATA